MGYPDGFDLEANPNDFSQLHFPGFHASAAQWLVNERNIVGVGVDTVSIDNGPSKEYPAHQILLKENIWALENLNNVDKLAPSGKFGYYLRRHYFLPNEGIWQSNHCHRIK